MSTEAVATKSSVGRKRKKADGRKKRRAKLVSNRDFAKAYHEGKSKRAADKKSAFRKKKSKKK